ncbi:MAG: hypothetical protein LQ352_006198, partial [Teloschistes flavicans]
MAILQNLSSFAGVVSMTRGYFVDLPLTTVTPYARVESPAPTSAWSIQLALISFISLSLLGTGAAISLTRRQEFSKACLQTPPQVPYLLPVLGHLLTFVRAPQDLFAAIPQLFGPSRIVCLNFGTNDVYVVSGPEYIKAVWKDTKSMSSCDGLSLALRNLFNTPRRDMVCIRSDKSGSSHDPHPQSSTRPEDRIFHHMFKATADTLTGANLNATASKFQVAMKRRIEELPIQHEWVEMDDLFGFLRPLIANATIEAVCGTAFINQYPDFAENFYGFNDKATSFLYGWPGFLMPRANRGRERCIAIMQEWRRTFDEQDFDGNPMMIHRWRYFSKMQGMSDYGVACQDVGIVWG